MWQQGQTINHDHVDAADPLLDRSWPYNWPSSHPGLLYAQEESEGKHSSLWVRLLMF